MENKLSLSNSIYYNGPFLETEQKKDTSNNENKGARIAFLIFSAIVVLGFVLSKVYFL